MRPKQETVAVIDPAHNEGMENTNLEWLVLDGGIINLYVCPR